MDKNDRKQVVYLDLEETKQKIKFTKIAATRSEEELATLEEQYASWLDLIDR
jgi:hypothetical protein